MNCKDCFHYEVCCDEYELEHAEYCNNFKDKSKILELPCKVGNTVYHYCKEICAVLPYFIERIVIDYDVDNSDGYKTYEAMCSEDDELIDAIDFTVGDFGKTVFLTKEEAEARLKELQNG